MSYQIYLQKQQHHSPMVNHSIIEENKSIAPYTWFQVGGKARYFYKPHTIEDLKNVIYQYKDTPIVILGAGSNVLVRDSGFNGLVLKLSKFNQIIINDNHVTVGAGCLNRSLVYHLAEKGLSNLEFMIGIPGSIGGAIAMNAGCYGFEVKDFLLSIDILTQSGTVKKIIRSDLNMEYRHTTLSLGTIILSATFEVKEDTQKDIIERCDHFLKKREASQPVKGRTGGSTFKNPSTNEKKAWELLDIAGCRGLTVGGAMMSEKHCNFLMNTNNATADDIEKLIIMCQEKVLSKTGIELEAEIQFIG